MKKIVAGIVVIAIIALVGFGAWYLSNTQITDPGMLEPIAIKTTVQGLAGLIFIAEDEGIFSRNGLNATIFYCDTGLACVKGMTEGDAEIAASSEYPVVGLVLEQEDISAICSIDKYQGQYIVGRKDRGIEQVSDLRGKEIGVARGTITEFYLGRFLYLNNISLQDVTLQNVRPSQFVDSIGNGIVDAILVPQVYLIPVEERLGSNAIVWKAQSNQNAFGVLTCRDDWIASHPGTINKLLKSLVLAENYAISHPAESKAILQRRLNYTEEYMATTWLLHRYSVTLDQSLITAMEDEGRWMIENNLTREKQLPNFLDSVHEDGLKAIKPEAVNIIR